MLVVSRGINDRVVFPSLGISVQVTKVKGSRVSLGFDAPSDVRIIRHELIEDEETGERNAPPTDMATKLVRHEFRNRVNRATLKLQLAAKHFAMGDTETGLVAMTAGMTELSAADAGVKAEMTPASEMTLAESKATFTVDDPKARRVLLVDDDENERTLMASYLQRCGMHVDQASDGLKALYKLSQPQGPDVVLLDMNMPNLDGPTTVRRIRRCGSHPNLPVFAVTGESIEDTGLKIADDSLTGWFQKPVHIDEIVNAISNCVVA